MDTITTTQTAAASAANAPDAGAGAGPPPLREIRIRVAPSPTEGQVFFDRGERVPRRPLVDAGRVEGKPELHVLRTPEGRVSLIGSHWLEPDDGAADDALAEARCHEHETEEEDA